MSVSNKVRSKFDDLGDTAALAGLDLVQNSAKDLGGQYLSISTMVSTYIAKPEPVNRRWRYRARVMKFLETSLVSIYANNEKTAPAGRRNYGVAEGVSCFLRQALRE